MNVMMSKPVMYLARTPVFTLMGMLSWNVATRADEESAEYKEFETNGSFEVREYPDLMLISTATKIDAQGRNAVS